MQFVEDRIYLIDNAKAWLICFVLFIFFFFSSTSTVWVAIDNECFNIFKTADFPMMIVDILGFNQDC